MDEQDLNSEQYEVAPQDTDLNESMHSEQSQIDAEAQRREEAKERDFKAMRQRQKEMELQIKARDELIERMLSTQQAKQVVQVEEPEEPDEDYIPAGKVKGIAKRTVQPLEKKIQELEQKLAAQEEIKRLNTLRTSYPDFDDVVNIETLEVLEKHEPELAQSIAALKDPYKIGLQSYKYIKALGLVNEIPESRRKKEVLQKLEKNSKTVQTPLAYDKRPIAQAFNMTNAERTKLYEEMMHYAGKANGL